MLTPVHISYGIKYLIFSEKSIVITDITSSLKEVGCISSYEALFFPCASGYLMKRNDIAATKANPPMIMKKSI